MTRIKSTCNLYHIENAVKQDPNKLQNCYFFLCPPLAKITFSKKNNVPKHKIVPQKIQLMPQESSSHRATSMEKSESEFLFSERSNAKTKQNKKIVVSLMPKLAASLTG